MQTVSVTIESIDLEGKGVARVNDKVIFIAGAIPEEVVAIEIYKKKSNFDLARIVEIIKPSSARIEPKCPNFGKCGGCSLQHIEFLWQVKYKEQVLAETLQHIGGVKSENYLPLLVGIPWNYRYRARLSVHYVAKKNSVLIGFREKGSLLVTDMRECLVLPQYVSELITPLRNMVMQLSIKDKITQIEVAADGHITVLVLRNMQDLTAEDEQIIKNFVDDNSKVNKLQIWLQPKSIDSMYPFYPKAMAMLNYKLEQFSIEMPYYPSEFTQVNILVNDQMVGLAVSLLEITESDVIADFFCGIGNFTLPIAKYARQVMGFEGSGLLVKRAFENAKHNNLTGKVKFAEVNLFNIDSQWLEDNVMVTNKWLIDPPRNGAFQLVKSIATMGTRPKRIVYISCNPATLARDTGVLVKEHGYKLSHIGVMNMFPHTSHIESIAVFDL